MQSQQLYTSVISKAFDILHVFSPELLFEENNFSCLLK